ncbi:sensor histidine kinase [hot springs metagenome]|uniref:Sensor histidine kinase n=1 Tax=hot springs metagenome TaxID=433727 RepID=A0A5J4KXT0_9ZZZZ
MGHIFFIASCIFIIWVIVHYDLYSEKGWKYILISEIFFILWNVDTFIGHIIEFWIEPSHIIGSKEGWDYFRRMIMLDGKEYLYYITKTDHIWFVPAMMLFFIGLREHLKKEKDLSSASVILPLLPMILIDTIGSFITMVISILAFSTALKLYRTDRDNTLWNYILWLSSAYVVFSLSRSMGHILQRILVPMGYEHIWRYIEPYSGSLNTFTFIVIGSVSLFFFRAYTTYLKISGDKKRIEAINADLTELNQELETMVAERTMSLMALTVADKVRNPAAVIGWTCKRILEKEDVPERLGENLRDVIDESEKLESIVKDFDALLKSKQSMFRYEDINEIVKSVISVVEKEADEKGIRLSVNLSDHPLKINTQKNLLRTAIFHIIRNAIEATPAGGMITVTTDGDNERIILSISDTGSGIPTEDIEKIFDPFFSTKIFRFGIGLPLVKQIVSEHLGEIKVQSEVGKGTRFKLIFPVRWIEKK